MILKKRVIISLIVILIVAALSQYSFVFPSYAEEKETTNIFFPLLLNKYPLPPTVFGGEIFSLPDTVVQLASESKLSWVRITAFDWSKISPNEPVGDPILDYDWSSVPANNFEKIHANGMHAIAIVKMTPEWAQKWPGEYCGPVAEAHLSDFANFLKAAVQKYSQEPYNVRYWELGNEPDVDPALVPSKSIFGCWGDDDDDDYGGGYYASMLKVAYPAIKSADPRANVLIGGLLLDCDPGDPQCSDPKTSRFFEGILKNGGGDYFDIVSYHGYPFYFGGKIYDLNHPNWNELGGVVLGKAKFLRDVMYRYGINKPLLHSEAGLLCPEWNPSECDPPGALFEDAKADYVVWLYTHAIVHSLEGSIWYTFYGNAWRNSALVIDLNNPSPAYYAFKFMTNELSGAKYTGRPANVNSKLLAYAFQVPGKNVWVIWSGDGNEYSLTLPAGYSQIYDKFGDPIGVSSDAILVRSPIYIELP